MAAATPFRSVYFDCDSTLTGIEGIDELCAWLPQETRDDVRRLTEQAMNGERPLAEVYETRLARVAPTAAQLAAVGALYVERVLPYTSEVITALQAAAKIVGIVSGGLLPAVSVLAGHLGIVPGCVHAVPLLFDAAGRYRDFDRGSLLWRNGGKPELLRRLAPEQAPIAFVGDGATDLETKGVVDLFVGFGGVVRRPQVEAQADVWLGGPDLRGLIDIVLTGEERDWLRRRERFAPLFER